MRRERALVSGRFGTFFTRFRRKPSDDFLHESKRLRVGGDLLRSDGERLSVVRRKGRKDTLLGPDGKPIPEEVLRSFLGGVDRETFIRVFGMSREELLSGGRAIMEGKGSVGESLFAAGLGGADLKGLLGALESEAQELFKPGGSLPKLNLEARTYKDLKTKIRDLSLPPKNGRNLRAKFPPSKIVRIKSRNKSRGCRRRWTILSGSETPCRLCGAKRVPEETGRPRQSKGPPGGVLRRTNPNPVRERPGPFRREDRAAKNQGDRR